MISVELLLILPETENEQQRGLVAGVVQISRIVGALRVCSLDFGGGDLICLCITIHYTYWDSNSMKIPVIIVRFNFEDELSLLWTFCDLPSNLKWDGIVL